MGIESGGGEGKYVGSTQTVNCGKEGGRNTIKVVCCGVRVVSTAKVRSAMRIQGHEFPLIWEEGEIGKKVLRVCSVAL